MDAFGLFRLAPAAEVLPLAGGAYTADVEHRLRPLQRPAHAPVLHAIQAFKPATDDATRALTDDEVGVAVFCAAMGHEKALERKGNGLFTRAVVAGLNNAQGVPYNYRDQRQYIHPLHAFVFDEV